MIGERFVRHLRPVQPRSMSRLNLFTHFLQRKIDDATNRASYLTPNGYGSRLLIEIIKLVNLEVILPLADFPEQLADKLIPIVKDLEKPIDVRTGKHTTKSLFIHSKTPCFELMTASRRKDPATDIPFGISYDKPEWKTIQPLRVADMGTTDLRFQIFNEQLSYQRQGPTHAIYTLDCLALVVKFVAYYKSQLRILNLDQCLLDFVHTEIIVPSLLKDATAIWLRNVYKQQFLTASPLESHTSTMWDVVNIDTIGTDFGGAMADVLHLKNDLKGNAISNQTVFSSLLLGTDGENFTSFYRNLYTTATTPDEQQYAWVDCLKNMAYWEFILMIASFTPDLPDVISLKRDVLRDVRFWVMMKPWLSITNSVPYKTMIRARLEGMLIYLNQA